MKLVRVENFSPETRVFVIQLQKQEHHCLMAVLACYSSLDLYIQPLSRSGSVNQESQSLLNDAMAGLRRARMDKLREFIKGKPARLRRDDSGRFRLTINSEDLEWLLQILNEIRVGCWIRLGRLEMDDLSKRELTIAELRTRDIMDLCAYFQAELLEVSQ
jgi:hypothetical protein